VNILHELEERLGRNGEIGVREEHYATSRPEQAYAKRVAFAAMRRPQDLEAALIHGSERRA
jgi:hypothetical protein